MSSNITLSSAIQSNLLALQNTQTLTNTTQGRLSTGLKVGSAIDDPVAYFQSKALSDRATDFQNNKSNIDQGISSLSTALQGITSIQNLVSQLKGLALSAQSASSAQIGTLVQQYNSLRSQINTLATDTSYQGLNLIAGSGQTLTVGFSNLTGSNLTVSSVDASTDPNGLNIAKAYTSNGGFQVAYADVQSGGAGYGQQIQVTYAGTSAPTSGTHTFSYGSQTVTLNIASAGSTSGGTLTTTGTYTVGTVLTLALGSGAVGGLSGNVTSGASTTYENTSGNFFIGVTANTGATVTTAVIASGNYGSAPTYETVTVTIDGLTGSNVALGSGTYTFNYGGHTVTFGVNSVGGNTAGVPYFLNSGLTFSNGDTLTLNIAVVSAAPDSVSGFTASNLAFTTTAFTSTSIVVSGYSFAGTTGTNANVAYASIGGKAGNVAQADGQTYLDANLLTLVNNLTTKLDTNLQTLRSYAQSLGTNVALLNTRLDFTNNYVNLLTQGSGKLTLADLNQEGANLLALQTRQQLGIQSLSFAGQNEKSILQLFR